MRIKLEEFTCKYFHLPPLLSFWTNYSRMYQNLLEYFVPFAPATEIQEYHGGEMILQSVFVAQRQYFKVKHSPGITLNKFV